MPLYTFQCEAGHAHDAIRAMSVTAEPCACGRVAKRQAVYPVTLGHQWASEFRFNSTMQAAHEEAVGAKAEMKTILANARANGFNG